jgi:ribonucleoside-triphosphate reductase (formate)
MEIRFSYDHKFDNLINKIKSKYGENILRFSGIHPEQLDIADFTRDFLFGDPTVSVADRSVDSNANVDDRSVVAFDHELAKSENKLNALNMIWTYIIKVMSERGEPRSALKIANEAIESIVNCSLYMNDSHFVHKTYCYSFDLTPLIFEGMPFVNKIHIGPPQHFSSMINLVIQSTAFISNQIAGAASYPNLFVYLDYFARKDFGEKYWDSPFRDQVEQGFQNLVYSLNYPFRGNQCVDENTEVLTPEGFKRYDEIFEGDSIYTWNKGSLNIQKVKAVNVYDHDGDMHSYKGRDYHQFVSPDHRILRKIHNGNTYELVKSKDAISLKSPIEFPVAMLNDDRPDYALTDEMIELAVFILTDGSIDKQNGKSTRIKWFKSPKRWGNERFVELMDHFGISYSLRSKDGWKEKDQDLYPDSYSVNCYTIPAESSGIILGLLENDSKESLPSWHTKLSRRQAQLFIETWASLDGNIDEKAYDRMNLQCDNYVIADQIQHICFLSGKGSQIQSRTIGKNKNETIYVRPYTRLNKSASTKEVVRYKGKIWCPTTDDGVVVFRKEGRIFISGNSAFTTLSIYDRPFLETLFENIVYPDGSKIDLDSVDYLQKWYFRWFNDESKKQVFTFPVTTANLACEDNSIQDESFLDYISEVNLDMGLLNIYSGPPNALSNCCRLRSKIVKEHTNSLGTGSVSIGSHRVCTINLPRIAIESDGDMGKFMEILKTRLYLTITILHAHRRIMEDLIKLGRLPLYTYNWMHLSKQYSTVGLIGPYEACKFMGMDITSQEGSGFITRIMDFINEVSLDEEALWKDGRRFNLELIPGEQAAIKMCEADKMIYASFPNPYKLYSNQFIPLIDKSDISERIRLQGHFDSRAQGGCIMHLNIDHQLTHKEQMKNLIRASVKAGAMYYAVNYNIAICKNKHQNIGKMNTCPKCGEKIHCNKTRVVGFITEESEWHKVRRWEYLKRVFYNETDVDESPLSVENDAHKTASA